MLTSLLHRLRRDESGISMVEVLVSAMVFVTGVLPAVQVFAQGQQGAGIAQNVAVASQVGSEQLEELRQENYASLSTAQAFTAPTAAGVADHLTTASGVTYLSTPSGSEKLIRYSSADETVGTGDSTRRFRVHRFVTLRTERCPLVSVQAMIDQVSSQLAAAKTAASSLATQASALQSSAAAKLDGLPSSINVSVTVLGIVTISTKSTAPLGTALSDVATRAQSLTTSATDLVTKSTALEDQLASLKSRVEGDGVLQGKIDPCQLPDSFVIPNVAPLSAALAAAAPGLNQAVASVGSTQGTVSSIGTLTSALIDSLTSSLNGALSSLALPTGSLGLSFESSGKTITFSGSGSTAVSLPSELTATATHVDQLGTNLVAGRPGNSVRITTAVETLDTGGGSAIKPVWQSTVVTNPAARTL